MKDAIPPPDGFQSLVAFTLKFAIVLALLGVSLGFVLPDFSAIKAGIKKNFQDERARLYVLSFIQNPAALHKTAEIEARNGKIDNAMRNMELAIGLLEMHGADKQVIKRYADRLEELRNAKRKNSPENKAP